LREGSSQTTNIANISVGRLNELPVPLAPLNEQKRIADKLDTVLTRVDAVNSRLARVAPLLKRFRQSVLAAATSGRLTEDWSVVQGAADWTPRTIESLCLSISDGPFGSNLKSDDYTDEGARVVRLENIGHLRFESGKRTFIALEKYKVLKKHTLSAGDLIFSSFVDEEVRVCEFPADVTEPAINKADCFRVRVDSDQVSRRFLAFRLACKSTYDELKALVHGATRPRINLGQLRSFEVRLPDMEEQSEIVRRVETLFAFADRLEARLQAAQTATERLTPALLAKAFRGELVPQDPNDEPASELLKRLASTAATAAPTRSRRKATSVTT
jgi:type I restriction enzyme S subunit